MPARVTRRFAHRMVLCSAAVVAVAAMPTAAQATAKPIFRGVVFTDSNANGALDGTDALKQGVNVTIQRATTVHHKTVFTDMKTVTTDVAGGWLYVVKSKGSYRVRVLLPAEDQAFSPRGQNVAGGPTHVLSTVAQVGGVSAVRSFSHTYKSVTVNAGLVPRPTGPLPGTTPTPTTTPTPAPASSPTPTPGPGAVNTPFPVSGVTWIDANGDGIRQDAEAREPGVTIDLMDAAGTTVYAETTSDIHGNWTLTVPADFAYRFRANPASTKYAGLTQEHRGDPASDSDFSQAKATAYLSDPEPANTKLKYVDAGFGEPVSFGDFVWHDLSKDGIQNAGEPGVAGVTLELWNADRSELLATTTSDASGFYQLRGAFMGGPGFFVHVVLPAGIKGFSPEHLGGNGSADSDIIVSGVDKGWSAQTGSAANPSNDADLSYSLLDVGLAY